MTPYMQEQKKYQDLIKITQEKFKWKEREYDKLQFWGLQIENNQNGLIMHQKNYISKIGKLSYKSTYAYFRSLQAKLSLVTKSRPDIASPLLYLYKLQKKYSQKIAELIFER